MEADNFTVEVMPPAPSGVVIQSEKEMSEDDKICERVLIRRFVLPNAQTRTSDVRKSILSWSTERMKIGVEYVCGCTTNTCAKRVDRVILSPRINVNVREDEPYCWCEIPERLMDMFILRSQVVRIQYDYDRTSRRDFSLREGTQGGITLRYLFDCLA